MNSEFETFVKQMAIENAILYKGTANPKALIGKVMPKFPDMKSDMKTYMQKINEIVQEVNDLGLEKQQELLNELNPNFHQEKEQKNEKKTGLPDVPEELKDKPLITRFPPAPSGNLHIGHLFGLVYNYEYAKQSGGKFIMRIEDTNPENISIENYDALIRDAKWICEDDIAEIHYQSDRIEIYYEYLEKLFDSGSAYACTCDPEKFKELIEQSLPSPCRLLGIEEQKERLKKMMNGGYKEGEVVIRFKSDLNDKNPAMRDFSIARIKNDPHARVGDKYKLWPMYNLCTAIDDSIMNISYIIRGKDVEIGGLRQDLIKDALGLKKAPYFHYGKMKFIDLDLSKTKLTQKIKDKEFDGWDDPRLATIVAFKRRGYKAEAFRKCLVEMGMSKRDSKITKKDYLKTLDYFNKEIIDSTSKRVCCVFNPYKVSISNFDTLDFNTLEIQSHPEYPKLGTRALNVENDIFIEEQDAKRLQEGNIIRLMHFANFKVLSNENNELKLEFLSKAYNKELKLNANIQFVFENDSEEIVVINEENKELVGKCETLHELKEDESLQFERFGFVRFDRIGRNCNKKKFYFTQK